MIKIGITGGIGSGKSVVSLLMEIRGIPVYNADLESKKLTEISPVIRKKLISLFGEDLYKQERLDRKLLASLIFTNPEHLRKVNGIIHPEVLKHFINWADSQTCAYCGIESAILFESGFNKAVDKTLLVYAPENIRIQRVIARDRLTEEEVKNRIRNQMPEDEKREMADCIIWNDDRKAIIPQIDSLFTSCL